MSKSIAFFDFDGTITTHDTMLELIRFHHGTARFLAGMLVLAPSMVMMKAGMITNKGAKEKMLAHFFGGLSTQEFNEVCTRFASERIPALIRAGASKEINKLKASGTELVLVSASAENWLKNWADQNGFIVLATELESKDGKITGRLVGHNCHGDEKVRRIRAAYNLADYNTISCYGDTSGDKPMLGLAQHPHYKPFRDN